MEKICENICNKPPNKYDFIYIRKRFSKKYYKNKGQFIMPWDTINQEDIKPQILTYLIIEIQNSPKQNLVVILEDFNIFSVIDKLSRKRKGYQRSEQSTCILDIYTTLHLTSSKYTFFLYMCIVIIFDS